MISMSVAIKFKVEEKDQMEKIQKILSFLADNDGSLERLDNYTYPDALLGMGRLAEMPKLSTEAIRLKDYQQQATPEQVRANLINPKRQ